MGVIYNRQNKNFILSELDGKPANNYRNKLNKSTRLSRGIISRKKRSQVITSDNINFLKSLGLRIKNHG